LAFGFGVLAAFIHFGDTKSKAISSSNLATSTLSQSYFALLIHHEQTEYNTRSLLFTASSVMPTCGNCPASNYRTAAGN
jgi:hypothetical protein